MQVQVRERCYWCDGTGTRGDEKCADCEDGWCTEWMELGELGERIAAETAAYKEAREREAYWNS